MKNMKYLLAAMGALLLVGAGCSKAAPEQTTDSAGVAPKAETGPIKIGAIAPLSGDAAVYGEPLRKVIDLAVEEINAKGGVNGRNLQMIFEDGKCNGKDGASAMQKLVNVDNVKLVIGGFCSSESLAAAPIANENKIVLFSGGSSSPDLTINGGKFFLRDYPSDAAQGKVLAELAYNKKGWRKVAVAQEQTDYALGINKAFTENFVKLGGQIVANEEFASSVTDFRTIVTKLKSSAPDALLVSAQTPKVAELVLKQIKQLNWTVPLLGGDVIPGSDLPKTSPQLVEGMLVAEFGYDADSQRFKDFVAAYKAKYNAEPEYLSYSQTMYDIPYMLADALKAVGEDSEKVLQWLHDQKGWEGVSGLISFDEHGDRTVGHKPEVIKDGKVLPFTE